MALPACIIAVEKQKVEIMKTAIKPYDCDLEKISKCEDND